MPLPLLAQLGISAAPAILTGIFGKKGPGESEKLLRQLLQGQLQSPLPQFSFAGSPEENIMNQLIQQSQGIAREQTSEVFGKVGRSVSGRGFLAPPGQGRGVLGALQTRAAVPIQRQLQREVTGLQTGALGQFTQRSTAQLEAEKNRRLNLMNILMSLEERSTGFLDQLLASIQGGGQLFAALQGGS